MARAGMCRVDLAARRRAGPGPVDNAPARGAGRSAPSRLPTLIGQEPAMQLLTVLPSATLPALAAAFALALPGAAVAQPATATYYQCPGNVFTNTISAKEAETRKCTPREAKEPTTITGPKPRAVPAAATSLAPAGSGPATVRVDPA